MTVKFAEFVISSFSHSHLFLSIYPGQDILVLQWERISIRYSPVLKRLDKYNSITLIHSIKIVLIHYQTTLVPVIVKVN
jgi:hypothetical protein